MAKNFKRQIEEDSANLKSKKISGGNSSKGAFASSPTVLPLSAPPPGFFPTLASSLKSAHKRIDDLYRTVSNHTIKENILEENLHYALREINKIKKGKQEMAFKAIMAKLKIGQGQGEASNSQAEKMKNHR
ncbi:hypothetical protein U1Q18_016577 [Sarracenia purpurea var. burkii]